MPLVFVHLSDIHFGQERGADVIIHSDVKDRLIDDAAKVVCSMGCGLATGVLFTGDIAFAGKPEQYRLAAEWLDRLATAIGCERTNVQVVPGNHDIDREEISEGCKLMLQQIVAKGESKLDEFLENPRDRDVLYGRFAAYRSFAEGYDCPLDRSGGRASERKYDVAPGRSLRFVGLNSALACSTSDQEGHLLLGARQHVLPQNSGEELVVLCHHPLHWLQDSVDARRYVRNRARVFICGHEHTPSVEFELIEQNCDLMTLSAGATVPARVGGGSNFSYNVLVFDWDQPTNGLRVTIIPRAWIPEKTSFGPDRTAWESREQSFVLGCPNFRAAEESASLASFTQTKNIGQERVEDMLVDTPDGDEERSSIYHTVLLRFFRDFSPTQRIAVLVQAGALPQGWNGSLSNNFERQLFDAVVEAGRLDEIREIIGAIEDPPPAFGN